MPSSLNIERLDAVARALGNRLAETAFVGGAVVELYVDDPAAPSVRNTADVDCVVPVMARKGMQQCTLVDFMPTDGDVLGFTNPWYAAGLENTVPHTLPSGTVIRLLALPWFVATKMAAVNGRGGDDLRFSHDFEDVIYLWDCIPDFFSRLKKVPEPLGTWLAGELDRWRQRPEWREAVECCVDQGSVSRVARILKECANLSRPWNP